MVSVSTMIRSQTKALTHCRVNFHFGAAFENNAQNLHIAKMGSQHPLIDAKQWEVQVYYIGIDNEDREKR